MPDQPPSGSVRRDRLASLAERVGPSIHALRGKPWITFLLLILFVVAAGAFSLQWALNAALHTRAEVVIPDLSGKNLEQALDTLSPLGLSLAKDGVEFDENFPSGAILRQAPPVGLTVREGKVVRVTISSGGKVAFVPELTGKTLSEAQNLLRTAGMAPGAVSGAYSQVRPEGEVLEQSPSPGTVGGRGQMVDLKVSKGPPPEGTLLMPDFMNGPLSAASAWADEKGLELAISEEAHDDLPPGTVVRQSPAPDSALDSGQKISVKASVPSKKGGGSGARWVRYQVPEGEDRVKVRVVLRDEGGEKVLFDEVRQPGAVVELAVAPKGPGRVRIYAGGVLVEERVIE